MEEIQFMKRIGLIFCIAATICVSLYFYLHGERYAGHVLSQASSRLPSNAKNESPINRDAKNQLRESDKKKLTDLLKPLTSEEIEVVRQWVQGRGWDLSAATVDDEMATEQDPYQAYKDGVLYKLADGGDRKAQQMVGEKLLNDEKTHKEAINYLLAAAARDYSKPFFTVSVHYQSQFFNSTRDPSTKKRYGVAAYGWSKVGKLRGDYNAEVIFHSIDRNLSEEERLAGDDYAKSLYQDLMDQRRALGMSEFDNSTPVAVQKVRYQTLSRNSMLPNSGATP